MNKNHTENCFERLESSDLTNNVSQKKLNILPIIALAVSASPFLIYLLKPLLDKIFSPLFLILIFACAIGGTTGGAVLFAKRKRLSVIGQILSLAAFILPTVLLKIIL